MRANGLLINHRASAIPLEDETKPHAKLTSLKIVQTSYAFFHIVPMYIACVNFISQCYFVVVVVVESTRSSNTTTHLHKRSDPSDRPSLVNIEQ